MSNAIVREYPADARIPLRGEFFDLTKDEVFFFAPEFDRNYKVSNRGRVMSATDRTNTNFGKMLRPITDRDGYQCISLRHDGEYRTRKVHRLVLATFIGGPPSEEHQAAHNDGDPGNNNLLNLRWVTPKENTHDRYGHGTMLMGEDNGSSKLTEARILYAHAAYASGSTQEALAEELGVSVSVISNILRGLAWKHLGLKTETRKSIYTDGQIQQMFEFSSRGVSQQAIANAIGCSRRHVGKVLGGKYRKILPLKSTPNG